MITQAPEEQGCSVYDRNDVARTSTDSTVLDKILEEVGLVLVGPFRMRTEADIPAAIETITLLASNPHLSPEGRKWIADLQETNFYAERCPDALRGTIDRMHQAVFAATQTDIQ
jgi:hypothetical protein